MYSRHPTTAYHYTTVLHCTTPTSTTYYYYTTTTHFLLVLLIATSTPLPCVLVPALAPVLPGVVDSGSSYF